MKRFFDPDYLESYSKMVLKTAQEAGADTAAVQFTSSRSSSARFAGNRIIQNMAPELVRMIVAVSVGKKETAVSMDVKSEESIKESIRETVEMCKMFPENPEHVSPIKSQTYHKISSYFDPEVVSISQKEKALIINDACHFARKNQLSAFGTFTTSELLSSIANSNGLYTYTKGTDAEFTITMRTEDGSGSSREVRSHHKLSEVPIQSMIEKTADWAKRSRRPSDISAGDYTVVLSPTAVLNYFMLFFWTLDARKVDEKRSALTSHFKTDHPLNQKLFSPLLSIRSRMDHPLHPRQHYGFALSMDGMGGGSTAETIFSMGLPVENYPIVEKGVLKHLFASRYWADKKQYPLKAFPSLIEFEGTTESLEELISKTENGLLINSFWYIRFVDPNHLLLTGLTRDGIFRIKNGEVKEPVKNLRFNESPLVSMTKIRAVGKPERRKAWFTTALVPPMVVGDFTFSVGTDAI